MRFLCFHFNHLLLDSRGHYLPRTPWCFHALNLYVLLGIIRPKSAGLFPYYTLHWWFLISLLCPFWSFASPVKFPSLLLTAPHRNTSSLYRHEVPSNDIDPHFRPYRSIHSVISNTSATRTTTCGSGLRLILQLPPTSHLRQFHHQEI